MGPTGVSNVPIARSEVPNARPLSPVRSSRPPRVLGGDRCECIGSACEIAGAVVVDEVRVVIEPFGDGVFQVLSVVLVLGEHQRFEVSELFLDMAKFFTA